MLRDGINSHGLGIELANSGACRLTAAGQWRNGLGVRVAAENIVEAAHKSGAVYFGANQAGVPTGHVARPGWEVFPAAQIRTAVEIARALVEHYDLEQIVGHDDISPGRKVDPGPLFDLTDFRSQIAGGGSNDSGLFRVRPGTMDGLAIRVGPDKDLPKVRDENLAVGTKVEFLRAEGNWWHVRVLTADGNFALDGWVHSAYLVED